MMIGDLARRAGVRQSAIRYYESVGLLTAPARRSGRRVYDTAAVTQVEVVRAARALGFGVREIRTLIQGGHSVTDRWRALARRKLPELEALIDRATRMKRLLASGLQCSCVRIEDCILHECAPPVVAPATLMRSEQRSRLSRRPRPADSPTGKPRRATSVAFYGAGMECRRVRYAELIAQDRGAGVIYLESEPVLE